MLEAREELVMLGLTLCVGRVSRHGDAVHLVARGVPKFGKFPGCRGLGILVLACRWCLGALVPWVDSAWLLLSALVLPVLGSAIFEPDLWSEHLLRVRPCGSISCGGAIHGCVVAKAGGGRCASWLLKELAERWSPWSR